MFILYLTICNIFRFGFEGLIWVLIASVPDLCMIFIFIHSVISIVKPIIQNA